MTAMVLRTAVAGALAIVAVGGSQVAASAAVRTEPAAETVRAALPPGVTTDEVTLIQRVRQASIVEIWSGQRAQQVAASPSVRWVGRSLLTDHLFLDKKTDEVASQLGITLPKEPTLQQQAGVRKMSRETGAAFDRAFANTLYFGHDTVMQIIKRVQAQLQQPGANPAVKAYATMAVPFVQKHMQWLMATGLVTAAVTTQAGQQAALAREVSSTQTYSNAIPATVGVGSLVILVMGIAYLLFRPQKEPKPRGRRAAGHAR
jgi:predicted outer membrane protein